MNTTRALILGFLTCFAAACGASQSTPPVAGEEPIPLTLESVSPDDVKANHAGSIVVRGTGFTPQTGVLLDGVPVPYSIQLLNETTLRVDVTHGGPGTELAGGTLDVQLVDDGQITEPLPLRVRPVLSTLAHLRTQPSLFLRNGGFLDLFVVPGDSDDALIVPGHELAGTGLGDPNFQWTDVTLTPVGASPVLGSDFAGVTHVTFDPVDASHPLAISLAIDQSGSIAGTGGQTASDPTDERITQSAAFVDRLGDTDKMEVLSFNGSANNVPVVQPFTSDKAVLKTKLDTLRTGENGGTPLYDAVVKSVNDAAAVAGHTAVSIVLTDGRDNGSSADLADAITAAQTKSVPVFTIGLGIPTDPDNLDREVLQQLADQTGGRFYFAVDPTALAQVFDDIAGILTDSYRLECGISFDPPATGPGVYTVNGNIEALVDGERVRLAMPPLNLNVQ